MRLSKYHGTGNDFVLIEDLSDATPLTPELVVALCDRRRGVGADGVIRIAPTPGADFFMDHYNADGQTAEMCGNGIRCLAKYVYDRGLTAATEIDVLTRAGMKHLVLDADGGLVSRVTVDMGPPALELRAIPMTGEPAATFVDQPLEVGGRVFRATAVSMGNPHCVLFLDPGEDPATVNVQTIGPIVEHRPEFPNLTNVEFVQASNGAIDLRVWERGVGETMACGTGACAALVASSLSGRTARTAEIRFPGGSLTVEWRADGHVFLAGPAVCVFDAEIDPRWLAEITRTSPGVPAGVRA
jgi:diaminopimelate epimerase